MFICLVWVTANEMISLCRKVLNEIRLARLRHNLAAARLLYLPLQVMRPSK
jgi:hypothetical protein